MFNKFWGLIPTPRPRLKPQFSEQGRGNQPIDLGAVFPERAPYGNLIDQGGPDPVYRHYDPTWGVGNPLSRLRYEHDAAVISIGTASEASSVYVKASNIPTELICSVGAPLVGRFRAPIQVRPIVDYGATFQHILELDFWREFTNVVPAIRAQRRYQTLAASLTSPRWPVFGRRRIRAVITNGASLMGSIVYSFTYWTGIGNSVYSVAEPMALAPTLNASTARDIIADANSTVFGAEGCDFFQISVTGVTTSALFTIDVFD